MPIFKSREGTLNPHVRETTKDMTKITKKLWGQVHALREEGRTQSEIGRTLGLSQPLVSSWLRRGEPRYDFLLEMPEDNMLNAIFERCVPGERGCVDWGMACDKDGYGLLSSGGCSYRVHRVVCLLLNNLDPLTTPREVQVNHKCDRPVCCNPLHLLLGTAKTNNQDMFRKGRGNKVRGSRHCRSKLTEGEVIDIRSRVAAGETQCSLAKELGIPFQTIGGIVKRTNWAWLDQPENRDQKGGK